MREVRFQWQSAPGNFVDTIPVLESAPALATLDAYFNAAMAAAANGADTVRETTREYDALGQLIADRQHSRAAGVVGERWGYDRFGDTTFEAQGYWNSSGNFVALNRTDYDYDAVDRVTRTRFGQAQYFATSQSGADAFRPERRVTYDRWGNVSTEVNERGAEVRYRYGTGGRLLREWDARFPGKSSTLQVDYSYDDFGRLERRTATDLDSGTKQHIRFEYTLSMTTKGHPPLPN